MKKEIILVFFLFVFFLTIFAVEFETRSSNLLLLSQQLAEDLCTNNPQATVVTTLPAVDRELLKRIAQQITAQPHRAAVLSAPIPNSQRVMVLCMAGNQSEFDCSAFVEKLLQATKGGGGGRTKYAEANLDPNPEIDHLLNQLI